MSGIEVPKGGGALKGIGETFQPDLQTGTANLSVPIPLPAGRDPLTPSLSLAYSSGHGNGPFGLGWSLAVPRVSRRTDHRVPSYDDTKDTFVLSGAEELVRVPLGSATVTVPEPGVERTRYRPRTETTFARIVHVTGPKHDDYWEVWSGDGLRSRYGTPRPFGAPDEWVDPAAVRSPTGQVFSWLLSSTSDSLGNRIEYRYIGDGGAQRYLSEVAYADHGDPAAPSYAVVVKILYTPRSDAFSDRRCGFELRTSQRAARIEVHTPGGTPATEVSLTYADEFSGAPRASGVSLLASIQVRGRDGDAIEALPPLTFTYSGWNPASRQFSLLPEHLPLAGLGNDGVDLIDLFGDGLPSLVQLDGTARYWRNIGGCRFERPRALATAPPGAVLGAPGVLFSDLDGDGRPELSVTTAERTTVWRLAPRTPAGEAAGFDDIPLRPAPSPGIALTDPQVRLIDLDGDHVADLWYAGPVPSIALGDDRGGFTGLRPAPAVPGLPALDFTDPRLRLADMTGDGMADLVWVTHRSVRYWPNLGHGRFGPPITMANAPSFPDAAAYAPAGFDPRRLLLGDVLGDGTADIVYIGDGRATVWVNQSGNGFSEPVTVRGTPRVTDLSSVRLADMAGVGVAGIVWSAVGPRRRMAFLDLTGGTKPYLLAAVDNHAGATTTITWSTSTAFAVSDRSAGSPWPTTLPFPVHVVAATTTIDHFSGTVLTTGYRYHDGYWDPADREFRGFGRVEQTDTLSPVEPAPPAPVVIEPLDPLTAREALPPGFDPAAQGNVLRNWSFDTPDGPGPTSVTTSSAQPEGGGASAAQSWTTRHTSSGTTTTELLASTLPQGYGGKMIHVTTSSGGCGLVQTLFNGSSAPSPVVASAWLYLVTGTVRVATMTGDGSRTDVDATLTEPGRWTLVQISNQQRATGFAVLAADGPAEFYVDHAWVRATDSPEGPVHSPPTRTVTWFHLGPIGPGHGGWTTDPDIGDYWSVDPPLQEQVDLSSLPVGVTRPVRREALRALRGRILRRELFADDISPRADRPYEVYDATIQVAPVLDGRDITDASWQASPVVTVREVLSRTTVWDRGEDPMTRITGHGNFDDYGRPQASADIGVPRRRNPRDAGSPCLASITTTDYATRDDSTQYLLDRTCRIARYEAIDPGDRPVTEFAATALSGVLNGDLRALELRYYDGPAFVGLSLGELGDHGLPMRTERLVLTPHLLAQAFAPGPTGLGLPAPPYLGLDGSTTPASDWPSEYPPAFRGALINAPEGRGPHLGYVWHPASDTGPAGYYAQTARLRYDVHTAPGRGLVTASRDAWGGETTTEYDEYQLLPAAITDPTGLRTNARYDNRVFKPNVIIDPNGNRTVCGHTPLGLPSWIARLGKDGVHEGDTLEQPGSTFKYELTAWDDSPSESRQPMSVTTTLRVDHRWRLVEEENARRAAAGQPPLTPDQTTTLFGPDEPDDHFIRKVEYSDGLGRLLQTRTQADDLVIDDLGLTSDPETAAGPVTAHRGTADSPTVVVSGWTVYDNKARPVVKYEPFFGSGYRYARPLPAELVGLARTVHHYDPRGLLLLAIASDRSETLTVPGIPHSVSRPDRYAPSPWERYTYDQNDNAGRTHPTGSLGFAAHWNTPASSELDAYGRTVKVTARPDAATLDTITTYDIDGQPLTITDPLGRQCADTFYDLAAKPWRTWLLDGGTTHTIRDATGAVIEERDQKGSRALTGFDPAHRPTSTWAADQAGTTPTLRAVTVYGDDTDKSGLTAEQARAANALGRPVLALDEAGLVTTASYDLDGNHEAVTRRILRPDLILDALPTPVSGNSWENTAYQVDWQPSQGQTFTGHLEALLDPTPYTIETRYDALGRVTAQTDPIDATGQRATRNYRYGPDGITGLTVDGTRYLRTVAYDAHGRRVLAYLGNGLLIRHLYDPGKRQLARQHTAHARQSTPHSWVVDGPVLQDHHLRQDALGNLVTLADRTPGCGLPLTPNALDRRFGYDPLNRLTSATGRETDITVDPPWLSTPRGQDITKTRHYTETYTYDPVNNLREIHHTTALSPGTFTRSFTLVPGSNRIASLLTSGANVATYTFDDCGNLRSETDSRRFQWDHANRLVAFRTHAPGAPEPSTYTQYRYNASGTRVTKLVRKQGGAIEVTIYLGAFERILTQHGPTAARIHDISQIGYGPLRLAEIHRGDPLSDDGLEGEAVRYQHSDHLTSITLTADAQGRPIGREEYGPYGETTFGSYARKRYRYTAKERDDYSGLSYSGARYYAPWLARWISCDPLGVGDGPNVYTYCRCNPMRFYDPSGEATEDPQLHLIQQTELRQPVTATAKGRGISQSLRNAYQELANQWMFGKVDVGHVDPFVTTPAGTTGDTFAQLASENRSMGATADKAAKQKAMAEGGFYRVDDADLTATPGTRYGQPERIEKLEGLGKKRVEPVIPKSAQNLVPAAAHPSGKATSSPVQLSLDFTGDANRNNLAKFQTTAPDAVKGLKQASNSFGHRAMKVVPIVGIYFGLQSMRESWASGDRLGASLDAIGFVPGAGDALDLLRLFFESSPAH